VLDLLLVAGDGALGGRGVEYADRVFWAATAAFAAAVVALAVLYRRARRRSELEALARLLEEDRIPVGAHERPREP
jgi:membrane protein implicated in regulation of membrane protease activity